MEKIKQEFTRGDVAKLLETAGETINLWTVMKLITPQEMPGGHGRKRIYSRENVIECFLIRTLQDEGFALQRDPFKASIEDVLNEIRAYNNLAKNKELPTFWENPNFNIYYRLIKYAQEKEPLRLKVFKDFFPDHNNVGPYANLEALMKDAYYVLVVNLGYMKRKIFQELKQKDI